MHKSQNYIQILNFPIILYSRDPISQSDVTVIIQCSRSARSRTSSVKCVAPA